MPTKKQKKRVTTSKQNLKITKKEEEIKKLRFIHAKKEEEIKKPRFKNEKEEEESKKTHGWCLQHGKSLRQPIFCNQGCQWWSNQ